MRILVAGAGGQVGRALLQSAPPGTIVSGLSREQLDITDEAAVLAGTQQFEPDVIINAAAYTAVDRAESESLAAQRANVDGARNLALAAKATGARIVHISTDFVFDGKSSVPYRPDAATNPLSVYGRTKLAGETHVLAILPQASAVVRTSWVYAGEGNNFLRTMLRMMQQGKLLRVVADQVGSPTSARSLAAAIWKITARPDVTGVHHWTDAGVASWYDFAVAIAEEGANAGLLAAPATVEPIATAEYPTAAQRPSYSVLDKRSLTSLLGCTPAHWRVNLRSVLREMKNA